LRNFATGWMQAASPHLSAVSHLRPSP
jgi:hypothetical protein